MELVIHAQEKESILYQYEIMDIDELLCIPDYSMIGLNKNELLISQTVKYNWVNGDVQVIFPNPILNSEIEIQDYKLVLDFMGEYQNLFQKCFLFMKLVNLWVLFIIPKTMR